MNKPRPDLGFLILLWMAVSAMNITKAFHIDDTFHLIVAEHIRLHPTEPMSGWINWRNDPVPMYDGAHPPLFFYMMALF